VPRDGGIGVVLPYPEGVNRGGTDDRAFLHQTAHTPATTPAIIVHPQSTDFSTNILILYRTTMGNKVSLEENLIDLKIVAKQMVRSSKKCEKNEAAAISKLKKVSLALCCGERANKTKFRTTAC
jgi:hypothetical protein